VIDLLDEAGARARMRRETESAELIALRQLIRRIARAVESAIANLDLEKARQWAEEERSERQNLSRLRDEPAQKPVQASTITPEDILEVVAERASASVASVRQTIEREADEEWERITKTLATGISAEGHEWLARLAGCSDEEAEKLAQAIRTARNTRKD
jgi:ATP-dependent Clp protease ATP-binding subunit ClpC